MKWLLVIKDHFTRFTALVALPNKEAKTIFRAINYMFGLLDFPFILQHDNGTEFSSSEILVMLKEYNKLCSTVIKGRPKTPCDQGSVENMNKFVKSVLSNIREDNRKMEVPKLTEITD